MAEHQKYDPTEPKPYQGDIEDYSGHIEDYSDGRDEELYLSDLHTAYDFALESGAISYLQVSEDA